MCHGCSKLYFKELPHNGRRKCGLKLNPMACCLVLLMPGNRHIFPDVSAAYLHNLATDVVQK
jgi:hypothetical protein